MGGIGDDDEGERLGEGDNVPALLIDKRETDGKVDGEALTVLVAVPANAAGQAPASTPATCEAVSAASQTRTSVKPPFQECGPVSSEKSQLPHVATASGMLCGATKGADSTVHTGTAAESTYAESVNAPAGVEGGAAVTMSVCHAPSAMLTVIRQSLPPLEQGVEAGHMRTSVFAYEPPVAPTLM